MIVKGESAIIDYDASFDQGVSLNLKKKIFTKCQHENDETKMKHPEFSVLRALIVICEYFDSDRG